MLRNFHGTLKKWYKLGRSRKTSYSDVNTGDESTIRKILEKSVLYTDIPRKPMPTLGWRIDLWNGENKSNTAKISVKCGGYDKVMSIDVIPNMSLLVLGNWESTKIDKDAFFALMVAIHKLWHAEQSYCEIDGVVVKSFRGPGLKNLY